MSAMNPVPGLSVIVIARNEERDLPGCLASVAGLASEIILADSGSTDATAEIARRAGAKVIFKEWQGYGRQKQAALDAAAGPWALNIDADERVSPELAAEIRRLLEAAPSENGFHIPFRHYFLGRRLRFGRFSTETHLRLFKKSAARYGEAQIHEGIRVEGATGRVARGHIEHLSYHDIHEYLDKCNRYTSMIARARYDAGQRFHPWHHARLPFEFLVRYVLKLGFLDGGPGLTYALLSSYYVWLKFLKLRDIEAAEREGTSR
jgi:glycosyltransferase involved in cell wall biosynthesis